MFKTFIQRRLEGYVKKYLHRHPDIKLVIVTGSVGKTSTKVAIGTILSEKFRVRLHEGNHNAELSTPLAILGIEYPENLKSIGSWLEIFKAARKRIHSPSDIDVIVQEVGSDGIGQVPHFGTYAKPYIAVVTAVSEEHMEFFKTIDAVAAEELSAANFSEYALINRDNIDGKFAQDLTNAHINTYGITETAEYHFMEEDFTLENGFTGLFSVRGEFDMGIKVTLKIAGEHSIRAAVAAGAVGIRLGMKEDELRRGFAKIRAVNGRMNILRGVEDTIIIDDTYNSSPLAASSALATLYQLSVPQRIAVLGSMNELGDASPAAHEAIGKICNANELAHVVTVGEEAEKYLAPAARSNGCHVVSFKTALEAGAFVHKSLEPGAAILFKGSQGGIYLEEAVKIVLHSTEEESKLVRQSPAWLQIKQNFFSKFN
ncbi:MAG: UDP-N-acetylmuramoyl-tripeptide-D-alanyl-D-alanine ligase [Candidatus Saccharibacteria bacterium]|nr:UDP-N-acetylmuramoyl-tripeptide-D-alanyl-D-alanine ligase [Candidatus Saccharibacteria bacterium]